MHCRTRSQNCKNNITRMEMKREKQNAHALSASERARARRCVFVVELYFTSNKQNCVRLFALCTFMENLLLLWFVAIFFYSFSSCCFHFLVELESNVSLIWKRARLWSIVYTSLLLLLLLPDFFTVSRVAVLFSFIDL